MRYYRVNRYLPPAEGKAYGSNVLMGIAAESVERAIEAVKRLQPTARIDGINDQGRIHNFPGKEATATTPLALATKPE